MSGVDSPLPVEPVVDENVERHYQPGENYFERNKKDLRDLFEALDRLQYWSDNPEEILEYTNLKWVGKEHGQSADKDQFTPEQEAKARPILEKLGLYGETLPPAGKHYDEAIVLGGTEKSNFRREAVAHKAKDELGVTFDIIDLWMGQRSRDQIRDRSRDEILGKTGGSIGRDIQSDYWVSRQVVKPWEGDNKWELAFATEDELGRVSMLKHVDAKLRRVKVDMNPPDPASQDVPHRYISEREFVDPTGQKIVIMNAAAIARHEGAEPRHTTRACAIEWLKNHKPRQGAQILFISSNPHTERTVATILDVFKEYCRDDIRVDFAGASAPEDVTIQTVLGEVGRLINNDVKAQRLKQNPEQLHEIVDLVDENDNIIGQVERNDLINNREVHGGYIRVVDCYIMNSQGELWVPRRTGNKKIAPNGLDFSIGEHMQVGEDYMDAIKRGFREEVDFEPDEDRLEFVGKSIPHIDGDIMQGFFVYHSDQAPELNPTDFVSAEWIKPQELLRRIEDGEKAKQNIAPTLKRYAHKLKAPIS